MPFGDDSPCLKDNFTLQSQEFYPIANSIVSSARISACEAKQSHNSMHVSVSFAEPRNRSGILSVFDNQNAEVGVSLLPIISWMKALIPAAPASGNGGA
jgi:hypothetical protein